MGMSASQARMLSLTARLSDLEFTAQSISNSKIRLADQSEEASRIYADALDKEKLTVMSGDTTTYMDATAYNLTTYQAVSSTDKQRFLKDYAGRVIVNDKMAEYYNNSIASGSVSDTLKKNPQYPTVEAYVRAVLGYFTESEAVSAGKPYNKSAVNFYSNQYTGLEKFLNGLGYTSDPNNTEATLVKDDGATSYYQNVFNEIQANGYSAVENSKMMDTEWLYNQLSGGNIFLAEWDSTGGEDGKGDFVEVSWSSGDATLQSKSDDIALARAEAKYQTTMASIQSKDKRFDLQLQTINTEHTAIQTEIDSVKKVIDKNIERSFKAFNA
jgi:hypothetical protein